MEYICEQPQINEMLQGFATNARAAQAAKRRNRSLSESGSGSGTDGSPISRVRRLSGGSSTVTLPTSNSDGPNNQKTRVDTVNVTHFRSRAGSFGSGRLGGHPRRKNDTASSSSSQRDLSKQQPRSRQNSCSLAKSYETSKVQGTARHQTSNKNEQKSSLTSKAEGSLSVYQKWFAPSYHLLLPRRPSFFCGNIEEEETRWGGEREKGVVWNGLV